MLVRTLPDLSRASHGVARILSSCVQGKPLEDAKSIVDLLGAQSKADLDAIKDTANILRKEQAGDHVSYVVNRNINFTNVCVKRCGFCAFSRDARKSEESYLLPMDEIVRRAMQARTMGATEVCIQAGLLPRMDPNLYINVVQEIKSRDPEMHIHAFSPEEILYGSKLRKQSIREFLSDLKQAGLGSLPGTSAEILNQDLRNRISPGRISVDNWIKVITTAHDLSIPTTSTMMYGHVEENHHIAEHLLVLLRIQNQTQGFTEFVPLSFVHVEAPMFVANQGVMRPGPSFDVRQNVHAVSRLVLGPTFKNIQVSWVKEGFEGAKEILNGGANDLGGTLMNESISTAAGSTFGQLARPKELRQLIRAINRIPQQRTTTYSILKTFTPKCEDACEDQSNEPLDQLADEQANSEFGSFHGLVKDKKFAFKYQTTK